MSQFDNVSVLKKANVYSDGKCISHTVVLADGARKSVGVMLPNSTLHFTTGAAERMELIAGRCRVTLAGQTVARDYVGGQTFEVAGDSSFDIEVTEALHYVCHFG